MSLFFNSHKQISHNVDGRHRMDKYMVALRESQIDVAAYKSVGCLSKNKEAFHKKHHINKFLQILNMFLCSCIFLDRFSKNSKYAPT